MVNLRVTCDCGAIYEVIETKGPSRESRPAKCVLCDRESHGKETMLVNCASSGVLTRIANNA